MTQHFPTPPKVAAPCKYTSNHSWIDQAPEWLGSIKRRNVRFERLLVTTGTTGPGGVPLPPTAEEKQYHDENEAGHHCSPWQTTCNDHEAATSKQKNKIAMYAALMSLKSVDIPVHAEMTKAEANAWLAAQWDAHIASVQPPAAPAQFNISATKKCSADKYQQFTTELHIAPTDELIYMGGLPPLPDHAHMHSQSHAIILGSIKAPEWLGCLLTDCLWLQTRTR